MNKTTPVLASAFNLRAIARALPVLVAAFVLVHPARATLLLYEGFDYATGSNITGQNGGSGFSGAWQLGMGGETTNVVGASGLTYPGVASTGLAVNDGNTAAHSNLRSWTPSAGLFDDGNVLWFSALVNTSATSSDVRLYFSSNSTVSFGGAGFNIFGGAAAGGTPGVRSEINGGFSPTINGTPGTTMFIVGRITFSDTAGADSITAWLNPASMPTTGGVTVNGNITTGASLNMGIRGGGNWQGTFDELRLGTTYADVIPEPATMGLLGLSLGMLSLRRRRVRRRESN